MIRHAIPDSTVVAIASYSVSDSTSLIVRRLSDGPCNLDRVTASTLRILGRDPAVDGPVIRSRLGVVPQQDNLDMELTVWENLYIYGRYFGIPKRALRPKIEELLDFAQLSDRARDKVEPLSGGMRRRLTIARSLINDPEILLLDEPTTGLDPQARHVLWDRLYRLKQDGVTLVLN